jgi:hypothetical protein
MAGLVPAAHERPADKIGRGAAPAIPTLKRMGGRDKPGHDGMEEDG